MPSSSNNASFIPKRGSAKRSRKKQKSQVYLLTVISYVLLFATLLATGGVFIYGKFIDGQLTTAINNLNQEIESFSEADLLEVQVFDQRLRQAKLRLDNSVSIASVFTALEEATLETIRFTSFTMRREGDERIVIDTSIETDSFDSSLFQRNTYTRTGDVIGSVAVEDLQLQTIQDGSTDASIASDGEFAAVSFKTQITIPTAAVPYDPRVSGGNTISVQPPTSTANPISNEAIDEVGGTSLDELSEDTNQPTS